MTTVVFSDLDGTLLDLNTYSFDAARPVLALIERLGIPLVLCSSKTRAEMSVWRERLGNHDPFIVENGGAVVMPDRVIALGDPYLELVAVLHAAAEESGCSVRGFHDMDEREVSAVCGLSPDDARRALAREYDEPFQLLHGPRARLLAAIEARGKRWTEGGRFYHITGANDKGLAVRIVTSFYREREAAVRTVAIGDSWNDVAMLRESDMAVVLPSPEAERIQSQIPGARLAAQPGPAGWNSALLELLAA